VKRQEAVPELMISLIMPFVQFVAEKQDIIMREMSTSIKFQECITELKDTIVGLFQKNILLEVCLKDQEEQVISDTFRLYL